MVDDEESDETYADRFRIILRETKRSKRELSALAGRSHAWFDSVLDGNSKSPEAKALTALATATGYSEAWLTSGKGPRRLQPVLVSDRVHPVVARVAKRLGYTDAEVEAASAIYRGKAGTGDLSEELAAELLEGVRYVGRRVPGRTIESDDDL